MKYIQDPDTLELIPAHEYTKRKARQNIHIMPDIKPYTSIIDGTVITSRSKHRKHLKEHNCIEVGNEKPGWMK